MRSLMLRSGAEVADVELISVTDLDKGGGKQMERSRNGRREYGLGRRGECKIRPSSKDAQHADAVEQVGNADGAAQAGSLPGAGVVHPSGQTAEQEHSPLEIYVSWRWRHFIIKKLWNITMKPTNGKSRPQQLASPPRRAGMD